MSGSALNGAAALELVAAFVIDDEGRRWVDRASAVQLRDMRSVLTGGQTHHYLTRARGYSKTEDMAAAALSLLLTAMPGTRGYWLAADLEQGRLALDSVAGFVRRTELLSEPVEVLTNRVEVPASGSSLVVLPADAAGSWGLRPAFVVLDELAQWAETESSRRLLDSILTALPKVEGSRAVVITTAGSPSHFAHELLEHAKGSPIWCVAETPGPAPWIDPVSLADQKARLPASIYSQLYENRWTEIAGDFVDSTLVDAAFRLSGPALRRADSRSYVATLDVGVVNDLTAFAIGHREPDGAVHVDLLRTWKGSRRQPVQLDEVGEFIASMHQEFRFRLVADPHQAKELLQRLTRRGVSTREYHFNQSSKWKLASVLLEALNLQTVALYPAEGLRDELVALRLKALGTGMFAFDHGPRGHDDRAVALAMLLEEFASRPASKVSSFSYIDRPPRRIERAGIVFQGERYLDVNSAGRRVPPPGWTEQ